DYPGCDMEPLSIELLAIHALYHPFRYENRYENLHEQYGGLLVLRCPIPGCKKSIPKYADDLTDHLLKHPDQERSRNSEEITKAGYNYRNCHPVCPLCGMDVRGLKCRDFQGLGARAQH